MKILKILETVKNFIKKNKKLVTVVSAMFCAVVLVAGSIAGTIAYLTSTAGTVTNTFTVGKVAISLNETDVDEYGAAIAGADRVTANEYKLIPGHTYVKDPIIYVEAKSEACWLFVKVENELTGIEAGTTIAQQMSNNGWTALTGVANVYYKSANANTTDDRVEYPVFSNFTVANNANIVDYASKTIKVTGYAIQSDGLADANAAWTAGGWS